MRHLPLSLATAALLRATSAQQPLNESDILGTLDALLNSLDGSVGNSTIDDVYSYVSDQAQAGLQAVLKYISPEQYWSYGRSPPVYPTRKFTINSKRGEGEEKIIVKEILDADYSS